MPNRRKFLGQILGTVATAAFPALWIPRIWKPKPLRLAIETEHGWIWAPPLVQRGNLVVNQDLNWNYDTMMVARKIAYYMGDTKIISESNILKVIMCPGDTLRIFLEHNIDSAVTRPLRKVLGEDWVEKYIPSEESIPMSICIADKQVSTSMFKEPYTASSNRNILTVNEKENK